MHLVPVVCTLVMYDSSYGGKGVVFNNVYVTKLQESGGGNRIML